ncbi:MAG: FAD-binding protein [Clostridiales bacterium]|nr:FAD-binding protein [Clostridiales bacterium]
MYDIIIIGAGPAGLTSAIYARMANKKTLVLEKNYIGGQTANIYDIKNYPGFENISGFELAEKMKLQSKNLGAEFKTAEVKSVNFTEEIKQVQTFTETLESKCVIIATGAYAKPLDVKNEKQFYGKGLSYCATCDGNFFKNKIVAVVGGGNTSMDDCLYLSNLAQKIYLIHRRDEFTCLDTKLDAVKQISTQDSKIEILTNTVVTALNGNELLQSINILNKQTNKTNTLKVDGLFVAIGRMPDTEIFKQQLKLTTNGFIETNINMETNIKNVYAVGDVRNTPLRQIVTACADGAVAVNHFIKQK